MADDLLVTSGRVPDGTKHGTKDIGGGVQVALGIIIDPADRTRALKPDGAGNMPVTGPVTDAQMRAAPIPVTLSGVTEPESIADGADVTQGAKADAAWDGALAGPSRQAIMKYIGLKIEAVRALLAGVLIATPPAGVTIFDTPGTIATAYTANRNIGGKRTLANAFRAGVGSGILNSLLIVDKGNQAPGLNLFFFNADPVASTLNDNAAIVIAPADMGKLVGVLSVSAGSYLALPSGLQVAQLTGLGKFFAAAGTSLYVAIQVTTTPTFGVVNALSFQYDILPD